MRKESLVSRYQPPVQQGDSAGWGGGGESHLKRKICENTRIHTISNVFRDRYGKYMEKDDLYLGYYLHLIQDMLYQEIYV